MEQESSPDQVPKWDESMALGHALIDEQHKWLFALAKEARQPDVEKAKKVMMELYRYTRVHFADEEAILKVVGYPLFSEHVEQHDLLLDKVCGMSESMVADPSVLEGLPALLARWLKDHILRHDRAYVPFLGNAKK